MDPQQLVDRQKREFQTLLGGQNQRQDQLFGELQRRTSAQPKLTDVLSQAQQERGVGGLQESINLFQGQVGNVKGLLDRLDENTQSRTQGTQANQAFLDRLRASEGGELNTQLGRLGAGLEPVVGAFDLASRDIGQLLDVTQADQARQLRPLETQINALGDRFSREITGFTQARESELDTLMDKLNRERQLADREWQRAQQLAAQEREFQRNRQLQSEQAAFLNPPQEQSQISAEDQALAENDAAYLGRLANSGLDLGRMAESLRGGNEQAQRRYRLGVELGFFR